MGFLIYRVNQSMLYVYTAGIKAFQIAQQFFISGRSSKGITLQKFEKFPGL
jgi:hypothetical protein